MKKVPVPVEVRRILSAHPELFAVVNDTLSGLGVGPEKLEEVIQWATGDGKKVFIGKVLEPLAQWFLINQRIVRVDENTVRVNLDAPPELPHEGTVVKTNQRGGWVEVQRRGRNLFVDGRKVILYRHKGGKTIKGYDLRDELKKRQVLHPNIAEALCRCSGLLDHIKPWWDENNRIAFWAATFGTALKDSNAGERSEVVACMVWYEEHRIVEHYTLSGDFPTKTFLSAVLESE